MKGTITIFVVVIIAIIAIATFSSLVETNDAGFYHVRQKAITGTLESINDEGVFMQLFAKLTKYQVSDMYYFSKSDLDGGKGAESQPIKVRFNDGGTADVSGAIKYKLSLKEGNQLALHREFKTYQAVQQDLIRQVVAEALMQTATLMKAEESYSTRRAEFTSLIENQIRNGIYETISEERVELDSEGNDFIEREVRVKLDEDGMPTVRKESPFLRYDIEILQFIIKDIDFDPTIDALIAKKKEAEQQKVVARTNAERAKQDAITEMEQGKARIAKAEADELVIKIQATTKAQKEFEVAEWDKKKAIEIAAAKLVEKETEAKTNALLVKAGLTPLVKAQIEKDTAIGVAQAMAGVKFPTTMVIGGKGEGGGSQLNPFDAVGLESFITIIKCISTGKKFTHFLLNKKKKRGGFLSLPFFL